MNWINLTISCVSLIISIGSFIFVCFDRWQNHTKIKLKKNAALKELKECNMQLVSLKKLLSNSLELSLLKKESLNRINDFLHKLTLVLGHKVIDDDIHGALYTLRSEMNVNVISQIRNDIINESQRFELINYLDEINEYINKGIKRLQ